MVQLARLTDISNHGAVIISGSHNSFTNGLANARFTDLVACPIPGHGINMILPPPVHCYTNNLLQARVTDYHACGGMICTGSPDRKLGTGRGGGVGDIVISAVHIDASQGGGTATFTFDDHPQRETEDEVGSKVSGDGNLGVTVSPSGKPIIKESVDDKGEVKPNTAEEKSIEKVPESSEVDYGMQLSPNFKLEDLCIKTAFPHRIRTQHGLSTTDIINNLKYVATNCLEPIAAKYGRGAMLITSGFRQGSSTSQHERGMAIDLQFKGQHNGQIDNSEMYNRALDLASSIMFDQMILEYLGNKPWIHISFNSGKNRKNTLTALRGSKYVSGFKLA